MADPRGCTLVFLSVPDGSTSGGEHERVAQMVNALGQREGVEGLVVSPPPRSRRDIREMVEVEKGRHMQVVATVSGICHNGQKWVLLPVSGRKNISEWEKLADLRLVVGSTCIDEERPEHLHNVVDEIIMSVIGRVMQREAVTRREPSVSRPPVYYRAGNQQIRHTYFSS